MLINLHSSVLLSFFYILIFVTTLADKSVCLLELWFALVLWYSDIYDNRITANHSKCNVVICFRSLIFWYLWQLMLWLVSAMYCCDLLSFFDILIFMTTFGFIITNHYSLWFAFVLWYSDIYDNKVCYIIIGCFVVICFRSLIFWYLWQLEALTKGTLPSCDLLSFFDILIFMTTRLLAICRRKMLWFAFVLWYSDIYDNNFLWMAERD